MVHCVNRPTCEDVVTDIEKDYKVKLPNRVALHFHDSFAMAQAADENGIGRRELLEFAQQLSQHNSVAISELNTHHVASAVADRRAAEAQA